MLDLFIVVTYVEQRLLVLPNTAGKKELYGSNTCFLYPVHFQIIPTSLSLSLSLFLSFFLSLSLTLYLFLSLTHTYTHSFSLHVLLSNIWTVCQHIFVSWVSE